MKYILPVIALISCFCTAAQIKEDKDVKEIIGLLNSQTIAWNKGNIDSFMSGYWQSDSLMFIGKYGITYGYEKTRDNYKRNYHDTAQMGQLTFNVLEVKKLSAEYYFVVGKWFLKRSVGDVGGIYTLVFRKIKGRWMIIADHSS